MPNGTEDRNWPPSIARDAQPLGLMRDGDEVIIGGPSLTRTEFEQTTHDVAKLLKLLESTLCEPSSKEYSQCLMRLGYTKNELALYSLSGELVQPMTFARADMVRTAQGFKLVEFNVGPCVGGLVDGSLPAVFGQEQCDNPLSSWARFLSREVDKKSRGAIIIDSNASTYLRRCVLLMAQALENAGCRQIEACSAAHIKWDGSSARSDKGVISWIYPFFFPHEVNRSSQSYSALLEAVQNRAVQLPVPLASRLLGSKAALGILSELASACTLGDAERSLVCRYLPWTSVLTADRFGEGTERRLSLVLKPATGYAGEGVVIGREVTQDEWESALHQALRTPDRTFVIQDYCEAIAEMAVTARSDLSQNQYQARFSWGFFILNGQVCGTPFLRCRPISQTAVINATRGAAFGPLPIHKDWYL